MTLLIVYFCLWSFGINAIWFCKASIQNNLSGAIPKRLNWLLLEVGGQGHKSVLFYFLHFQICHPVQCQRGCAGAFSKCHQEKRGVSPQTDHQSIIGLIQTRTGMYIHSQGRIGVIYQPGVTWLWEKSKAPGGYPHRGYANFR